METACRRGDLELVKALTIDLCEDEDGNTPLHLACLGNYDDTIEKLLQNLPPYKFQVNKEGHSPLHLICSGTLENARKIYFIKALLQHDPALADSNAEI